MHGKLVKSERNEIYRFNIGRFQCTAINDGLFAGNAKLLFGNAPGDRLAKVLEVRGLEPDNLPSPLTCLLVKTENEVVLIDTGMGRSTPLAGNLIESLPLAGIGVEEIDIVILSHIHNDHSLGIFNENGEFAFPNARYVMSRYEYEYWTVDSNLESAPQWIADTARKVIPALAGHVHLVDGRSAVVPGIEIVPSYGHTVGHIEVEIFSEGQNLLYLADSALHPIHLAHPEWTGEVDQFPEQTIVCRKERFEYAAETGSLVLGYHFNPFPSLGYIEKDGDAWRWRGIETKSYS